MAAQQQTFEGAPANDAAEFEASEAPTSPWDVPPLHVERHIAFENDALEAWAATQTPELKEERKASHALWLAEQPEAVAEAKPDAASLRRAAHERWLEGRSEEEHLFAPLADQGATEACTAAARGLRFLPYDMCAARRSLADLKHEGLEDTAPEPLEPLETKESSSSDTTDSSESDTETEHEEHEEPQPKEDPPQEALKHRDEAEDCTSRLVGEGGWSGARSKSKVLYFTF